MTVRAHLRTWKPWRWAVVFALLLVPIWPAQAMAAIESPPGAFDLQAAIDACPAGGTVEIPAGTFTVTSQVVLRSGVALQGAGIDQTILTMPPQSTYANVLVGVNVNNVAVRDLTIRSGAYTDKIFGIHMWNYSNVTVERVKTENCRTGIKLDEPGSGFTLRDWTSRGDYCPIYMTDLTDGLFEQLDIANSIAVSIYVAANNYHLRFNEVSITQAGSWGIQLWYDDGWATPSDDIELTNFDVNGRAPIVVGRGYTNVSISDLTISSTELECIRLYDPHDVLVEDFACSGGPFMLGTSDDPTVPNAERVTVRNGTYSGSLVAEPGIKVTDLTIENVNPPSTTTTTVAPTTTTTVAPTTTTTVAPTTTTSAPPTTTTSTTTTTTLPPTVTTTTTTTAPSTTSTTAPTTTTASLETEDPPAADAVTITTPENGSEVQGRVTVRVEVTSTVKVGEVQLLVDGQRVNRDRRAPYSILWNTGSLTAGGVHTLTCVAYDRQYSEIGRASCQVTIGGATDYPAWQWPTTNVLYYWRTLSIR